MTVQTAGVIFEIALPLLQAVGKGLENPNPHKLLALAVLYQYAKAQKHRAKGCVRGASCCVLSFNMTSDNSFGGGQSWKRKRNAWKRNACARDWLAYAVFTFQKGCTTFLFAVSPLLLQRQGFLRCGFGTKKHRRRGAGTFLKSERAGYLKDMYRSRWRRSLRACRHQTSSEEAIE